MAHSHTPRNSCVRFVFGVAAASRNTRFQAARYGLTWVGLAPTDRASFAWRLPSFNHFVRGNDNVSVLRGRALSRLEIDDQLEFHGLLDWQAWMLDPAEFGGGCLRNLGPHGFDMFLPWGRRSSTVTWPKDECADEFFREPRDRSVPSLT